ncbi:ParB/RepB/Spo0J family partition protein [Arthrobacter sp. TMS1-12-1]
MAEKRRGLGRGLGALIPSAPAEEVVEQVEPERVEEAQKSRGPERASNARTSGGRPVDLFFERVTEDDVAEQPRSYSSALRSGINKNVLEAQTKRVAKGSGRKPASTVGRAQDSSSSAGEKAAPDAASSAKGGAGRDEPKDQESRAGADSADRPSPPEAEKADRASPQENKRPGDAEPVTATAPGDEAVSRRARPETGVPSGDVSPSGESAAVSRETPPAAPVEDTGSNSGLLEVPGATFAELSLASIHPNRKQPRVEFNEDELAELVHSIREIGVLQPVVVRPSKEAGDAPYELVMGERRLRASREAGMETIPAIIRSTLDDDLLRDALLENLHRSALNPLEEAAAYQQLLDDFGCSHDELAGRLGRSRPQISNTLRLMKLPPLVQRRLAAGVLSAGHARALLGLADHAEMEKLAQRIVAEGLSVRSTEEIVALSGGLRRATKSATPRDGARHERLDYLASSLSDRLDTSVKITLGAKKGRVSIEFASVDDLNRIIGVLSPSKDRE